MRADKYLHHIRIFKTRSLATLACDKGNVKIGGMAVKPSRDIKPGDVIEIQRGELHLTIQAIGFPAQRVGPPRVAEFCKNLTSPEAWQKAAEARRAQRLIQPLPHEELTKPDKKQMRQIREWLGRE